MSEYTTGEIAKLCGISVRTVQFYDQKGILHPSNLTEGGRRLYSNEDLRQMQLICFFKSLGLSLNSIKGIIQSDNSHKVLLLLLDEQEKRLSSEIEDKSKQKEIISAVRECILKSKTISQNLQSDIENTMRENNKRKLYKVYATMLIWGSMCTATEIVSILLWVLRGNWYVFAVGMPIVAVISFLLTRMYYHSTAYICPECSETFRPSFRYFFFARHTMKTRRLICPHCGKKEWCVEVYEGN